MRKKEKMTEQEKRTLLDMVPTKYREQGEGEVSFGLKDNPDYELRPSEKNPRVRRWQRKGAGNVAASQTDDGKWTSNLYQESRLDPAGTATVLLTEIANETSFQEAVPHWANTQVRVVKGFWRNLFLPTPKYFPDTNEIVLGEKHLSRAYAERYGADAVGTVLAHELAHAWDFAVAKARGHEGKSYWMSEIMPDIVKATGGNAPRWANLPEFKRFKYATLEAAEMPAVLTEYMLRKPEHYVAIDTWFKRHHNISIKETMARFWGTDIFNNVHYNEDEVARLLAKMDSYRTSGKREKWKSRIAREISYTGEQVVAPRKSHQPDPGFIKLSVLERQARRSAELHPIMGTEEEV